MIRGTPALRPWMAGRCAVEHELLSWMFVSGRPIDWTGWPPVEFIGRVFLQIEVIYTDRTITKTLSYHYRTSIQLQGQGDTDRVPRLHTRGGTGSGHELRGPRTPAQHTGRHRSWTNWAGGGAGQPMSQRGWDRVGQRRTPGDACVRTGRLTTVRGTVRRKCACSGMQHACVRTGRLTTSTGYGGKETPCS